MAPTENEKKRSRPANRYAARECHTKEKESREEEKKRPSERKRNEPRTEIKRKKHTPLRRLLLHEKITIRLHTFSVRDPMAGNRGENAKVLCVE